MSIINKKEDMNEAPQEHTAGRALTLTGSAALLHFLVDALCACCLMQLAAQATWADMVGVVMVYNVMAFLTQPLTGMLADRTKQPGLMLGASAALLAMGVSAMLWACSVAPLTGLLYVVASLLGMGNSLFHVWGGKRVAVATGNDAAALGLFVAPGALGLAVGMLFHSWWLLVVLLTMTLFLAGWQLKVRPVSKELTYGTPSAHVVWLSVLALMALVMIRSLLGESFSADMGKAGFTVLAIGGVAMLGKIAGGVAARWIGVAWTLVAVVILLLLFRSNYPLLSLLLVNMTMAVTLWLANRVINGREGLVFGLLAAALMPGYLLAQFGDERGQLALWLMLTLVPTVVIELVVLWCLRERRADVLWSSVVANVLTNVPLHVFIIFVSDSLWAMVVGEVLVVLVETAWYRYFAGPWRQAFIYSFLCNSISCVAGMLMQLVAQLVLMQM